MCCLLLIVSSEIFEPYFVKPIKKSVLSIAAFSETSREKSKLGNFVRFETVLNVVSK